jgi:hypothetical protein
MFNQNIISNKFNLNLSTTLSSYIFWVKDPRYAEKEKKQVGGEMGRYRDRHI